MTVEELVQMLFSLRSEMEARVAEANARADRAEARSDKLATENAELRARLGKNSNNSSKPPSSDPPYKAKPPGKKSGKKAGGQPGHAGTTRGWVPPENVDRRVAWRLDNCGCGASLLGLPATLGSWSRQVVEIPEVKPHVTEFSFEYVRCPCCNALHAPPPVPPEATTCTGPNLTALAAALVGEYHLSRDAAAHLLASVLGMPISAATVDNCCQQLAAALATATAEVDEQLPLQPVVHIDETSWKQHGLLHWMWIAVGVTVTAFAINRRRGADQLAIWFPKRFGGVVNCDRWRPYEVFARRQLCWSHLDRDLQAIIDFTGAGAQRATLMLLGSVCMFATWHRFKQGEITRRDLQQSTQPFRNRLAKFCGDGERQKTDRKWRNLGRDLRRQWSAVFRFLDEEGIEPTNNSAERGLRSGVIWRRTTQGTRTDAGSIFVARIMTAAANCKRHRRGFVEFLAATLLAHRAGEQTPSLLPADS